MLHIRTILGCMCDEERKRRELEAASRGCMSVMKSILSYMYLHIYFCHTMCLFDAFDGNIRPSIIVIQLNYVCINLFRWQMRPRYVLCSTVRFARMFLFSLSPVWFLCLYWRVCSPITNYCMLKMVEISVASRVRSQSSIQCPFSHQRPYWICFSIASRYPHICIYTQTNYESNARIIEFLLLYFFCHCQRQWKQWILSHT